MIENNNIVRLQSELSVATTETDSSTVSRTDSVAIEVLSEITDPIEPTAAKPGVWSRMKSTGSYVAFKAGEFEQKHPYIARFVVNTFSSFTAGTMIWAAYYRNAQNC